MKIEAIQLNLFLAWLWILFGFLSGMVLGLFFHGEQWLGANLSQCPKCTCAQSRVFVRSVAQEHWHGSLRRRADPGERIDGRAL